MKKFVLVGLAAASALALAAPASAQAWGGWGWSGDGWQGRRDGDWRGGFSGYPEFRRETQHIRQELREGRAYGWLDDDEARDLDWRLDNIRRREADEFREHGWALPDSDRDQIRSQLDRLDRRVDAARDRGDNGDEGD